jgi:hypothetical protein
LNDSRLSRLEDRLEGLEKRLQALESRIAPESHSPIPAAGLSPEPIAGSPTAASPRPQEEGAPRASFVSLLGRFFIILGGAFLLRAATEANVLPAAAGVLAGLLYGAAQLWFSARAARRDAMDSANWFGFGAAVILIPLIAESTLDFGILPPTLAAVLLPVLGFAGVAVAFQCRLRPVAWAFLAAAGSVGLFMSAKTGFGVGFPAGVIMVGLGGLWMGYLRHWYGLAIVGSVVPVAMVMGISLLVALEIQGSVTSSLTPAVGLVLQLMLVAGFLGSFLARALRWSAPVGTPEMAQAVIAMVVGIVGALVSATKDPSLTQPFGLAMLVTGLGCYAISFRRIDRRDGPRRNFAFFSTVALAATLTGSAQVLDGLFRLALFLTAALVLAYFGARRQRATLSLHAALYVVGAGFSCGLFQVSVDALTGAASLPPSGDDLTPMLLVVVVGVVCLGAPVARAGRTWGRLSRLPKGIYLGFLCIVMGGLAVTLLTASFAARPDGEFDAGMVAAFRTGVISILAVVLGFLSRWGKLREGARLVPALLVLGALALALGDLRDGRPATQFASLALYGIALITGPRLARRARSIDPGLPRH